MIQAQEMAWKEILRWTRIEFIWLFAARKSRGRQGRLALCPETDFIRYALFSQILAIQSDIG